MKITLPIEPKPWIRPANSIRGGRYNPSGPYQRLIKIALRRIIGNAPPLACPLAVTMRFYFRAPRRPKFEQHAVKPDLDNLCKNAFDACNGVLWKDDALIFEMHASKIYDYTGHSRIEIDLQLFEPNNKTRKTRAKKNSST